MPTHRERALLNKSACTGDSWRMHRLLTIQTVEYKPLNPSGSSLRNLTEEWNFVKRAHNQLAPPLHPIALAGALGVAADNRFLEPGNVGDLPVGLAERHIDQAFPWRWVSRGVRTILGPASMV